MNIVRSKSMIVGMCAGVLLAVSAVASAESRASFHLSANLGISHFLSDVNGTRIISDSARADSTIRRMTTKESVQAPQVNINLHFSDWVVSAGYQGKRRYSMEMTYSDSPLIDRISATTKWASVTVERQFPLSTSWSFAASLGASRGVVESSGRLNGRTSSVRLVEWNPILGLGLSKKFQRVEGTAWYLRRFADDDADSMLTVSIRIPFGGT